MEVMEAKERIPKETKGKTKEKNQAWDEAQSAFNKEEEDDGWGRKRKLADYDPYEGAFSDDSEYEYDSGDDVYKGNVASFTTKEVQKIKAKGVASFYNLKFKNWHCPYCTTKPKPKDGRFDHLLSHGEDVAIHGEDYKIRGQRAALAKALTSV
ncbi:hypothetical protein D1007_51469 [Hordeum vulgare]|nr:hypothetical protein D1007_51469 [Hordeum vulgare]